MALVFNGSNNTITGLAVGGLPDGIVDADTLASNSVTTAKILDNNVTGAKTANEMTSGSTSLNIGGMRVVQGSFTTSSSVADAGSDTTYPGARYYTSTTISYSGFATVPVVTFSLKGGYHEAFVSSAHESETSTTAHRQYFASHRSGGITSNPVTWTAIGVAS